MTHALPERAPVHRLQPTRRTMITALGLTLFPPVLDAADLVRLNATVRRSIGAVGLYNPLQSPRFHFRGTGFFVGDGTRVVTCWHVLPQPGGNQAAGSRLVVQVPDGSGGFEHRDAEVLADDRRHDLAVLRIGGSAMPALPVAMPDDAQEGMSVAFVGYPIGGVLGFAPVIHRGIVSSLVSSIAPPPNAQGLSAAAARQARDGSFVLLQLDATAYPGNSGGPLIDAESGRVIGVVSMVLLKGTRESALTHPSGISYAVPTRYLAPLLAGR